MGDYSPRCPVLGSVGPESVVSPTQDLQCYGMCVSLFYERNIYEKSNLYFSSNLISLNSISVKGHAIVSVYNIKQTPPPARLRILKRNMPPTLTKEILV